MTGHVGYIQYVAYFIIRLSLGIVFCEIQRIVYVNGFSRSVIRILRLVYEF